MKHEQYAELSAKLKEFLEVKDDPKIILDRNLRLPSMKQTFYEYKTSQTLLLSSIESEKEAAIVECTERIKKNSSFVYTNKERREVVSSEPEIVNLNKKIYIEEYYLNFLVDSIDSLNSLGFTIKNWIEFKKSLL